MLTLQGPDDKAVVDYLSQHRGDLVHVLEQAERDRAVKANEIYNNPGVEAARPQDVRRRNAHSERLPAGRTEG